MYKDTPYILTGNMASGDVHHHLWTVVCGETISWTLERKDWSGKRVYNVSVIVNIWTITGEFS